MAKKKVVPGAHLSAQTLLSMPIVWPQHNIKTNIWAVKSFRSNFGRQLLHSMPAGVKWFCMSSQSFIKQCWQETLQFGAWKINFPSDMNFLRLLICMCSISSHFQINRENNLSVSLSSFLGNTMGRNCSWYITSDYFIALRDWSFQIKAEEVPMPLRNQHPSYGLMKGFHDYKPRNLKSYEDSYSQILNTPFCWPKKRRKTDQ